ncbi:TetR/AcrR family transcriptional regulator [Gordonia humi]|uniref:AcrR family transcriptional regulator n=1 Tax=Gordonia humi TaxID=686429 RepID=A0A840EMK6_9ACTN|nr:TetR/AcrR family transcriptional regulator [Gordonia humi]MBB4134025.1 AcrR family transcriptional regulator [Gordonia humi]
MTVKDTGSPRAGRRIHGLDAAERAAQRRQLLLHTALELFSQNGFSQTSIEALCQTAYVGNKAFYENFATKEDCYLALFQRCTSDLLNVATAALEEADADGSDPTDGVVRAFVGEMMADPRIPIVLFGQAAGVSAAIERQRRINRREAASLLNSVWARSGLERTSFSDAMAVAVIGGIFDLVADLLDRSGGAPSAHDASQLEGEVLSFVSAVRTGMMAS